MALRAGAAMVGRERSGRYAGCTVLLTVAMAETMAPNAVFLLSFANTMKDALPAPLGREIDWVSLACWMVGVDPAAAAGDGDGAGEGAPAEVLPLDFAEAAGLPFGTPCGKMALKTENAMVVICCMRDCCCWT